MTTTTHNRPQQAGKLASGADIKTAKPGAKLRFGNGLYLLVSPTGTKSWQVHYHVADRHQATIVGRWPDLGIVEAKAKREEIRQTVRAGDDPAHERRERRTATIEANAATVRVVGDAWIKRASVARNWSPHFTASVTGRMVNHVYTVIGERPIGRVTTREIETLVIGLSERHRTQAVHVRQHLSALFDFALRRKHETGVTENLVRTIAEDLPRRVRGDEAEVNRPAVTTIEDARAVLDAVEMLSNGQPFAKLAHRLIALTAVRKREGIEAEWSEFTDGADGWTWTIPAKRMKGRVGKKRPHVIPLAPQAIEVLCAARALARSLGVVSPACFPGRAKGGFIDASVVNAVMNRSLSDELAGRHTVHGWRTTFYTVMKRHDRRDEAIIDLMLAHQPIRPSLAARHYDDTDLDGAPDPDRLRVACAWADLLLDGASTAFEIAGLAEPTTSNVVQLREAA
jgi:integrase